MNTRTIALILGLLLAPALYAQTFKPMRPAPKFDMASYLAEVRRCDKAGWPTTLRAPNASCIGFALAYAGEWVAEHHDTYYPTPAAQTAKPTLPTGLIAIGGPGDTGATTAEGALWGLVQEPPCGYWGGIQQDDKGACSLTIILHNGPPEDVCTLGYDDTRHAPVITCTWKPKVKP
jgi:hypothetical protein